MRNFVITRMQMDIFLGGGVKLNKLALGRAMTGSCEHDTEGVS
jgi:hypothetical protein